MCFNGLSYCGQSNRAKRRLEWGRSALIFVRKSRLARSLKAQDCGVESCWIVLHRQGLETQFSQALPMMPVWLGRCLCKCKLPRRRLTFAWDKGLEAFAASTLISEMKIRSAIGHDSRCSECCCNISSESQHAFVVVRAPE